MSNYTLYDFILTVPTCVQTTSISGVLEMFSLGQCECLVVVSEQQYPIGVLYPERLMPLVISSYGCEDIIDVQQPLSAVGLDLVEFIGTLSAELSVEQFGSYLRQNQTNTGLGWALVDSSDKFLGVVDSPRLLQFLANQSWGGITVSNRRRVVEPIRSLVHLLERLPLPLMLQTTAGEIVTQNRAWQRQLGALSDPDSFRQEVAAILKVSPPQEKSTEAVQGSADAATRCHLSAQPDTYICICPLQNGQEQVWQFVKIPLSTNTAEYIFEFNTDVWLVLAEDVTKQQQLASELAAKNADLIQLNRLKDEFLACISHELKTPLTAVLGLSTLLKNQALGQLNERQARYAKLIYQSGRHLMTVVNDILDLTRMETGQLELALEPVQIRTICDRAIEQARAIQSKNSQSSTAGEPSENSWSHGFTLLIEPGLDSFVADELRLRQMLVHLLSNAFKFTEASGEIGLRVNRWEGWIAFNVWDTGIGISEQKQHLIFQKFQQLENPLTRQFEGAGLGLVLTRALARLHGGDVSFLSKEGKGSEFTLLLPPSPPSKRTLSGVGAQPAGLPLCPAPIPSQHRNCLVLIVEAAPRFIEDLTKQLTGLGYRVVIARSGTEALEKARRLQPKAIFLNPLLPMLSGWDLLTLLKSNAVTRHIPVIVTATQADKEQAFANRADEFLSLPVQQQALQQILVRCVIQISQSGKGVVQSTRTDFPLTILRLVTPDYCKDGFDQFICPTTGSAKPTSITPSSSFFNHRVLEADDLEQAELLVQFWQPDVLLLDKAVPDPLNYLKQLSQYPSLKGLPLVTLDAATTQAANQVPGLSVFPCLTPGEININVLLPVLQIASGMNSTPSLIVVNVATLPDLQFPSPLEDSHLSNRFEWFQALIQYLQIAGFRGIMARSWAEVLQQIRQQSVDLLLIGLGESKLHPQVVEALMKLGQQHDVPPVLVLDQRLSHSEVKKEFHDYKQGGQWTGANRDDTPTTYSRLRFPQRNASFYNKGNLSSSPAQKPAHVPGSPTPRATAESHTVDLEKVLGAIATRILPSSLSMEELLDHIYQTLPHIKTQQL